MWLTHDCLYRAETDKVHRVVVVVGSCSYVDTDCLYSASVGDPRIVQTVDLLQMEGETMKWYISGKISGLPTDQVTAKFRQAEQQIRAFGHEPVNPIDNGLGSEASWNEHLVADVALLLECDAIYLLKDWGDSRGSRIEANIAEECGLQIVHQPEYATYESRI